MAGFKRAYDYGYSVFGRDEHEYEFDVEFHKQAYVKERQISVEDLKQIKVLPTYRYKPHNKADSECASVTFEEYCAFHPPCEKKIGEKKKGETKKKIQSTETLFLKKHAKKHKWTRE